MSVLENIVEYMNSYGTKRYNRYQASAIQSSIKQEYYDRRTRGINIKSKTKAGKIRINKRIVDIANDQLTGEFKITAKDVVLFKKCHIEEYSDRKKKCAWGFKEKRIQLGYDPDTGYEIESDHEVNCE